MTEEQRARALKAFDDAAECWTTKSIPHISTENHKLIRAALSPQSGERGEPSTLGLIGQVEAKEEVAQWVRIQKALYGMTGRRATAKGNDQGEVATELAIRILGYIETALATPAPEIGLVEALDAFRALTCLEKAKMETQQPMCAKVTSYFLLPDDAEVIRKYIMASHRELQSYKKQRGV